MILKDKTIVLAVTGSIAAYKAVELARLFIKKGALVDVVMTASATKFVTPLTFQAVTHRPVTIDLFDPSSEMGIDHIALAKRADIVIVAPATANTIAKCAVGMADNAVTATVLATEAPILCAPAMETTMWDHPATQENVDILQKRGVNFLEPEEGSLASGGSGKGRMVDPETIVDAASYLLSRGGPLSGVKSMVTLGPTREFFDPVRFISNPSSGKMGMAMAQSLRDAGSDVVIISGPTSEPIPMGIETIPVVTAKEMKNAVLKILPSIQIVVGVAAVTDYRPVSVSDTKIKKDLKKLTIDLIKNPDILEEIADWKRKHPQKKIFVVGFAAETENEVAHAASKLNKKSLDMIIANKVPQTFGADEIVATIVLKNGKSVHVNKCSKEECSEHITANIIDLFSSS